MIFYTNTPYKFRKQRSLSVDFITYFTVIPTTTYIFRISTFPKPICDKTTAKKCWSLSKIPVLDVETAFPHTLLATRNVCPLAIPEFIVHNMGIRLLANHSFTGNCVRFDIRTLVNTDNGSHRRPFSSALNLECYYRCHKSLTTRIAWPSPVWSSSLTLAVRCVTSRLPQNTWRWQIFSIS